MKRILFILVLIFLSCEQKDKISSDEELLPKLWNTIDSLEYVINRLEKDAEYYYDENYEGEKLLVKGIKNPKKFIDSSLRVRTDLIPLKAVLGGTMRFGKITLLSSEWLIAEYDDSHISGISIYEYKLNEMNELEFDLLAKLGPEDEE
ncbi:MAG: hypothetical protein ACWA5P_13710 [bacterium]